MPYRELAPPPRLSEAVECFWALSHTEAFTLMHRVVPDGCADIVFTRGAGQAALRVAGPMTRFMDFNLLPGQLSAGVRFRPGMWPEQVGVPGDRITDALIDLDDLWGAPARRLLDRMADARSAEDCVALLAGAVRTAGARTPVQHAIGWMETRRGSASIDALARHAGLSARQFRRVCLRETGLGPKLLARVLRFRHALSRVRAEAGEHAGLAADCGYADQSHLIADFRRFSGYTPASFARAPAL